MFRRIVLVIATLGSQVFVSGSAHDDILTVYNIFEDAIAQSAIDRNTIMSYDVHRWLIDQLTLTPLNVIDTEAIVSMLVQYPRGHIAETRRMVLSSRLDRNPESVKYLSLALGEKIIQIDAAVSRLRRLVSPSAEHKKYAESIAWLQHLAGPSFGVYLRDKASEVAQAEVEAATNALIGIVIRIETGTVAMEEIQKQMLAKMDLLMREQHMRPATVLTAVQRCYEALMSRHREPAINTPAIEQEFRTLQSQKQRIKADLVALSLRS